MAEPSAFDLKLWGPGVRWDMTLIIVMASTVLVGQFRKRKINHKPEEYRLLEG